jgi:phage shock protein PspC (stress-responsive transcriptional regulator)
MICSHCTREIADNSNYCKLCGAPQRIPAGDIPRASKRLVRSLSDKKIAGVCGGIAEYFDIDSSVVRLLWVLVVLMPIPFVPAFLGYFVAWIVMPKAQRQNVFMAPPASTVHSTQTV